MLRIWQWQTAALSKESEQNQTTEEAGRESANPLNQSLHLF